MAHVAAHDLGAAACAIRAAGAASPPTRRRRLLPPSGSGSERGSAAVRDLVLDDQQKRRLLARLRRLIKPCPGCTSSGWRLSKRCPAPVSAEPVHESLKASKSSVLEPESWKSAPGRAWPPGSWSGRGSDVVAVEPGRGLAGLLRRDVPEAAVLLARLEDAELSPGSFDSVVAATSMHQIDLSTALPSSTAPRRLVAVWRHRWRRERRYLPAVRRRCGSAAPAGGSERAHRRPSHGG